MADGPSSPGGGSHENVSRIMKKTLPANRKIVKDAKETVLECVSEFIGFITNEASDKCQREKRKTINGDDLLWAMATLGFEDYIDSLKIYLTRYREMEGDTKGSTKGGDTSGKKDVQPGPNAPLSSPPETQICSASMAYSSPSNLWAFIIIDRLQTS